MKRIIIFDIDGTLADVSHRVDRIPNWKHFQTDHHLDTPIKAIVDLFQNLEDNPRRDYAVYCVSARMEHEREATNKWLTEHGIYYNELILRQNNDIRDDDIFKEEVLQRLKQEGREILFVVEDRKRVVDMWRRNGVTCLQCADGDF